jgi:NAD(P)-dependent dehydrogenase (short-subunit alcohol dehydrogenase family)
LTTVELRDRHVVVTGAGSGIGRALAVRFARERPRALVVSDIDGDAAQRVADEIGGTAIPADVGTNAGVIGLIDRARSLAGEIDLFFSNAGIGGRHGGPEVADDDWQRIWEVNLMAHVWAARALLPAMVERGEGYLACTASAAGLLAEVSAAPYSVTKHAAVAFAEWVSINYADAGVRVSCLCPQGVRTPLLDEALKDPVGAVPLLAEGLLDPEEVAEVTVAGLRDERFLILPHPRVADHMAIRGAQPERWLGGMRKLVRTARVAARSQSPAESPLSADVREDLVHVTEESPEAAVDARGDARRPDRDHE